MITQEWAKEGTLFVNSFTQCPEILGVDFWKSYSKVYNTIACDWLGIMEQPSNTLTFGPLLGGVWDKMYTFKL
jgi:hypothetical protein